MWKGTQRSVEHLYFEMCACVCTTDPLLQTPQKSETLLLNVLLVFVMSKCDVVLMSIS